MSSRYFWDGNSKSTRLNYSWAFPLHKVGIIRLVLCQLLYKVQSLYFYYKSTRKKLKLHVQGETQTHRHISRCLQKYWAEKTQLLPVSEVHSRGIFCCQTTNHLQHSSPTTGFHQCIQPLPAGCRPGSPIALLLGELCSGREMKRWASEVLSSRKGTRMKSRSRKRYFSYWNNAKCCTKGACVGTFSCGLWSPYCSS